MKTNAMRSWLGGTGILPVEPSGFQPDAVHLVATGETPVVPTGRMPVLPEMAR